MSPGEVTVTVPATCGSCGAPGDAGRACPACGRLQPFPPGADPWAILGVARRLDLDAGELEQRFHELSRRLHPDYFRLRAPEEQATSLDNAAAVNGAYRALRDPLTRVETLLAREGMAAGTGRAPAELFEELLEIQELRQELGGSLPAGEAGALRGRLGAIREDLERRRLEGETELRTLLPRWDAGDGETRGALLARMRDLLAARAYLRTVVRDLDAALGQDDGAAVEAGRETGRERGR